MSQEENNTNDIMIMKSEDESEFRVSREVASMCKVFNICVEDDDTTDNELPCPNVSTNILAKVVEYCTYYKNELKMDDIDGETQFPGKQLSDIVTQEWYVTFVRSLPFKTLLDLVQAADYLDIPSLLNLALLEVSIRIQGSKRNIVIVGSYDSSCNVPAPVIMSHRCMIESVYDGVHEGEVLGYGIGGLVRLITHKKTGTNFALKTLSLDHLSDQALEQVRQEVGILMELDHPNIVKLNEVYQTDDEIYLVQELCLGGDLYDRLDEQPEEHYSEAQCARLIKQILCAVRYIHSKGIVHRDLKLENFLFDSMERNSELKMIDFGLSKHFKSGETHHEPVGTRYTVAPEVLTGAYDEKVDIWAIGVITYLLLSGDTPFGGSNENESVGEVKQKILQADYAFEPQEYWYHASPQAKQFISSLLVLDPEKRPTALQCQNNAWLTEWANKDINTSDNGGINPNVIDALRSFRNLSDMRKLLCEVVGYTLLPEQVTKLRKDFEKLDVEQSGEISLQCLKKVLIHNAESGNLGNLIEEEVEDIFNSLRLHKSDTIHWHHFLAAGLSEICIDERNHRLAFDKIDSERKGYITFDDVTELSKDSTKNIKDQWMETAKRCNVGSKIHFKDFVNMMEVDDRDDTEKFVQVTL